MRGELKYIYPPWVIIYEFYYPTFPSVNIEFEMEIEAHCKYIELGVSKLKVDPIDESAIVMEEVMEST